MKSQDDTKRGIWQWGDVRGIKSQVAGTRSLFNSTYPAPLSQSAKSHHVPPEPARPPWIITADSGTSECVERGREFGLRLGENQFVSGRD